MIYTAAMGSRRLERDPAVPIPLWRRSIQQWTPEQRAKWAERAEQLRRRGLARETADKIAWNELAGEAK